MESIYVYQDMYMEVNNCFPVMGSLGDGGHIIVNIDSNGCGGNCLNGNGFGSVVDVMDYSGNGYGVGAGGQRDGGGKGGGVNNRFGNGRGYGS